MAKEPAAIQGTFSTNWNSAFDLNPVRIGSDTRKVSTVTAKATPRSTGLLSLGINSSSRTPSIGRNVVRLSRLLMNSCSFMQIAEYQLFENVVTQDHDHAKGHGPGIVVDQAGLHVAEDPAESHDHTANTVDDAINDYHVEALPEEPAKGLAGIDKDVIIDFIHIPLVVDGAMQSRKRGGKSGRDAGILHIQGVGDADTDQGDQDGYTHQTPFKNGTVMRFSVCGMFRNILFRVPEHRGQKILENIRYLTKELANQLGNPKKTTNSG